MPPLKDSHHNNGAISFLPPSTPAGAQALTLHIFSLQNSEQMHSLEGNGFFSPAENGKEVGARTLNHSSQQDLSGNPSLWLKQVSWVLHPSWCPGLHLPFPHYWTWHPENTAPTVWSLGQKPCAHGILLEKQSFIQAWWHMPIVSALG
jgi:hypothetical protein